ncbi:hypothetical protein RB195_004401 [Necator americanus]|uniref:SCP domain-containing protein n=1 Tax=Necator americanus TaxID=51031 RepID=A0ABR1BMC1_NECAM
MLLLKVHKSVTHQRVINPIITDILRLLEHKNGQLIKHQNEPERLENLDKMYLSDSSRSFLTVDMKAIFLVVPIASLALLSSGQGHGNAFECRTPEGSELQSHLDIIDVFYLELRTLAARGASYQGHPLGDGGQMYALLFNSSLYDLAKREIEKRKTVNPETYGLFRLERQYKNEYTPVMGLAELMKKKRPVLEQMIYPNATEFGCAFKLLKDSKEVCQMRLVCVLDKRNVAPSYELEGKPCKTEKDCTYLEAVQCRSPLCYTHL